MCERYPGIDFGAKWATKVWKCLNRSKRVNLVQSPQSSSSILGYVDPSLHRIDPGFCKIEVLECISFIRQQYKYFHSRKECWKHSMPIQEKSPGGYFYLGPKSFYTVHLYIYILSSKVQKTSYREACVYHQSFWEAMHTDLRTLPFLLKEFCVYPWVLMCPSSSNFCNYYVPHPGMLAVASFTIFTRVAWKQIKRENEWVCVNKKLESLSVSALSIKPWVSTVKSKYLVVIMCNNTCSKLIDQFSLNRKVWLSKSSAWHTLGTRAFNASETLGNDSLKFYEKSLQSCLDRNTLPWWIYPISLSFNFISQM